MRPGREVDTKIAQSVFGYSVKVKQNDLWEESPSGERPLRRYSQDISSAWEVVEKMSVTLIPVENNNWFAFVGHGQRWKGPAEFLQYLQSGQFAEAGAAVGEQAPLTICIAALKAIENRASVKLPLNENQIIMTMDPDETLN